MIINSRQRLWRWTESPRSHLRPLNFRKIPVQTLFPSRTSKIWRKAPSFMTWTCRTISSQACRISISTNFFTPIYRPLKLRAMHMRWKAPLRLARLQKTQ